MLGLKRRRRVRLHLIESVPTSTPLPSVEGLLLHRWPEYVVGLPSLLLDATANPAELESKQIRIPRDRVAFYEVIS